MNCVRMGIVGLGNMGTLTANFIHAGEIENCVIGAVCDICEERLLYAKTHYAEVPAACIYTDYLKMLETAPLDAVYIAVPHYLHPEVAIAAFAKGLHVITEKPEAVYTEAARRMNEAYDAAAARRPELRYAIMYNQRTNPYYQRIREISSSGRLGVLRRVIWNITNWYRTQAYYDSSDWRATWEGEGAGVLLNQSVHNLDLWQWMLGMPRRIRAFAYEGKYHDIQVEDDVTIYAEYACGATGVFMTSTGEYPGANRLEIQYDAGKIIYEGGLLRIWSLSESARSFSDRTEQPFSAPELSYEEAAVPGMETAHRGIMTNFVNAILRGEPLIASGKEGIYALSLCNAALLSSWKEDWVSFAAGTDGTDPLLSYEKEYKAWLDRKISDTIGKRRGSEKKRTVFLDLAENASGGSLGSR